jgi:putative MATE family efflux protein
MKKDLTQGKEAKVIFLFALPIMMGNLFQQFYNIADTIIVGRCISSDALASVGSAYTLMVFITSIVFGLCNGSSVIFSLFWGAKRERELRISFFLSFVFIFLISIMINVVAVSQIDIILSLLSIPQKIYEPTKTYLLIIFAGYLFTFLYNYGAAVLRSMGNSVIPLIILAVSCVINIVLDLVFVLCFSMGIAGAAWATVIAQAVSAVTVMGYCFWKIPEFRPSQEMFGWDSQAAKLIFSNSVLSSIQQSVMNFGILMIQGLVNSFGVVVMAGFAAAVKIESFAYMPVQDLGNALSTYVAQNKGAQKPQRIQKGIRSVFAMVTIGCIIISAIVVIFSRTLLTIFVDPTDTDVIQVGMQYLSVVGFFYCLIGYLFMLYGIYRGLAKTWMSIVLTVISLGSRVVLAYLLSAVPAIGLWGIWWAIPIGWLLADLVGYFYYLYRKRDFLEGSFWNQ